MFLLTRVLAALLFLAWACTVFAAAPPDTTPSHNFVWVEHDLPGIYYGEVRAADFNGDGKPDLVLFGVIDNFRETWGPTEDGDRSGRVMVYFNESEPGKIRFKAGPVWKPGDGKCDWLGQGAFGEVHPFDYDADEDVDFVVCGRGKGLVVFTNDGKGNFEPAQISRDDGHMAVGDFNGDGRDDVAHTNMGHGKGEEFYLFYDGKKWQPCGFHFEHNMGLGDLVAGDIDGDGWTDLVVGGNTRVFGSHRAKTVCYSQWNRNLEGRIDADPAFIFSTLGRNGNKDLSQDGMDNGSYDLTDLNQDGHLDVVFAGSHGGFRGDRDQPFWPTPEDPDCNRTWIHYGFLTFIQQPPFDGKHWKAWEFNGGGGGCLRTSCVAAGDLTGDDYPDAVHIGHGTSRPMAPPYDLPRRWADGFEGARCKSKGDRCNLARYVPRVRAFENDGTGALRCVYHDSLIPVDLGAVILADLDGDKRRDLVYCGLTRVVHYNMNVLDRNQKGETILTAIYRNVPLTEPRLVVSPVVESVEVGRERDFRVIYYDGKGGSKDVTDAATVKCANDHVSVSGGKARGVSLGSTMLLTEYQGCKAESLFHVFEHPMKPLKDRREEGLYLSVSPSSISVAPGATRDDFVVTLHDEDGSTQTVEPSRVFACQPDRVSFADGTATAHQAGPAAITFHCQLPSERRAELQAVCYITVVTD